MSRQESRSPSGRTADGPRLVGGSEPMRDLKRKIPSITTSPFATALSHNPHLSY